MAIVTAPLLTSLRVGFNKTFEDAKAKAPVQWPIAATHVPSTSKSTTYGWLGQYPQLREWVGPRVMKSMKEHGYTGCVEGVLQWGYALCPARAGKVVEGTVQGQYVELNRMWLSDDAPRNSESRAISYALKYIKRACPSVAWVQSFADERCKGLGVVYQACSFLYVGCHTTEFYELDGQTYHKMLLTAHLKGGQRGEHLRNHLHRATKHSLRQFRYVRFLKTDWQRRLRMPVLPYPKPDTECQK